MPVTGSLIAMFRGYEELHTWEDHESGMVGIIAIHNTNLGPALGRCRRAVYPTLLDAFFDVARLSRGMTYKAATTDYYNGSLPFFWGGQEHHDSDASGKAPTEGAVSLDGAVH